MSGALLSSCTPTSEVGRFCCRSQVVRDWAVWLFVKSRGFAAAAPDSLYATPTLRNAQSPIGWWSSDQGCEPSQVLATKLATPTMASQSSGQRTSATHRPRFSPLEVCVRQPRCAPRHIMGPASGKPSHKATSAAARRDAQSKLLGHFYVKLVLSALCVIMVTDGPLIPRHVVGTHKRGRHIMTAQNTNTKAYQTEALSNADLDLVAGGGNGNGNNGSGHGKAHQNGSKAVEERSQTYYGRLRTGL